MSAVESERFPTRARSNPYIGPRAFREGEWIYGRDRETAQIVNLLIAERIVLLYSPSGAGKTSLIRAALIPRLKERNFQVLPVVRVNLDSSATLHGSGDSNRYVLSALLSLQADASAPGEIPTAALAEMTLPEYLGDSDAGPH